MMHTTLFWRTCSRFTDRYRMEDSVPDVDYQHTVENLKQTQQVNLQRLKIGDLLVSFYDYCFNNNI